MSWGQSSFWFELGRKDAEKFRGQMDTQGCALSEARMGAIATGTHFHSRELDHGKRVDVSLLHPLRLPFL